MNFDEFLTLPDNSDSEVLMEYFKKFLEYAYNYKGERGERYIVKSTQALLRLAELQWETYKPLDEKIRKMISQWIDNNWISESEESTDLTLSVVGFLGLKDSLTFMENKMNSIQNRNARLLIHEALKEFGNSVEYPYSGMRVNE